MKVLSRIDGSVCGAILSTRPSATRATVSSLPKPRDDTLPRAPASQCRQHYVGLARAQESYCPQTASWLLATFLPAPSRSPRPTPYKTLSCRQRVQRYSHATAAAASVASRPGYDAVERKEHLRAFVDDKDVGTVEEHLEFIRDPYLNRYAEPEPTKVLVSERKADHDYPSLAEVQYDDAHLKAIMDLSSIVGTRLAHPHMATLDAVYAKYTALPEPRMIQMPASLRHRLLAAFGAPLKRDAGTMLRYFSLIGDVKDSGLALRRNEWNYALSLASRYVGRTTETEVESALQLWREMEMEAEMGGNDVTFNILFDAASKAGNFALAEMIYKEMETRGVRFTRYHHVSLIHFFGLKQDADGIRAAYKEAVEAGELIDTAVLNCVISSFLRCGEEEAALKVYEHMKATLSQAASLPNRDFMTKRMVTRVLVMLTKVGKKHPALRPQFQAVTHTTPDIRTYRALINHFAIQVGNLNKVAQLMDEMQWFEVPLHGSIFLMLFKGFRRYGGFPHSDWSAQRLQSVFSALLQAVDQESSSVYLDTWLMMSALRSFHKCTNKETVIDVYDEFKKRWKLEQDRAQFMDAYLNKLLERRGRGIMFKLKEASPSWHKAQAFKQRPV